MTCPTRVRSLPRRFVGLAAAGLMLAACAPAHAEEPLVSSMGPIHRSAIAAARQLATSAPAAPGEVREDPRFQLVLASVVTAASADIAMTMYAIGNGSAREAGFGGWFQDSPVAFAVTKSALSAAFIWELQQIHRTHPKAAFILGLIETGVEASLVARTAHINSQSR